ncbi:fibrosin-1-like protein [Entelurus aequoreus]|uniref:fibrosin-1-like protein n=1 Tax=Entelurus aequoreus TaxID=161455 RepID=UPI002B1E4107|nr:fibrosin-1-like protein [Entelurus aequoreus]
MDGKLKQGRRCRPKRERVRRLRETTGSGEPDSLEGHAAKKTPRPAAAAARAPRAPRRKRRESGAQEEDIIDGFAITSFISLDSLEEKTGLLKIQEKKERWKEKKAVQQPKTEDEEVGKEQENVLEPMMDPLENGFFHHAQREQERMTERLLKKTYSKKNKLIKPLMGFPVKFFKDETELGLPHRSNTKEQVAPAAVTLLKCDSESDIDDKGDDVNRHQRA